MRSRLWLSHRLPLGFRGGISFPVGGVSSPRPTAEAGVIMVFESKGRVRVECQDSGYEPQPIDEPKFLGRRGAVPICVHANRPARPIRAEDEWMALDLAVEGSRSNSGRSAQPLNPDRPYFRSSGPCRHARQGGAQLRRDARNRIFSCGVCRLCMVGIFGHLIPRSRSARQRLPDRVITKDCGPIADFDRGASKSEP